MREAGLEKSIVYNEGFECDTIREVVLVTILTCVNLVSDSQ